MRRVFRAAACGAFLIGLLGLLPTGAARAQCSIGDYLGTCASDFGFAGCCSSTTSIQWCEGALLCGIDCSGNGGSEACCSPSELPGCGNATIEACVCDLDEFCCDAWFGVWDEVCVEIATLDCGACDAGGAPPIYCGWVDSEGFYDCREQPSADPTGANPMACGASCTPVCGGKQCGADGCGGSCGTCAAGASCSAAGQCVSACTPACGGKECGPDGCGCACGQCTSVQTCNAGQCEDTSCEPACGGKECGADGCGGTCGFCAAGKTCSTAGHCEDAPCAPRCDGRACGDDGCGGSCGACPIGESCQAGACVAACAPSCTGRLCGDDGCGGSCGTCGADERCQDGGCVSACSCQARQCGDDGCGRVCGYCVAGSSCNLGTYQCEKLPGTPVESPPVAEAKECPPGQVWSAYAAACVIDLGGGATSGVQSDEGCVGGGGSLVAMLALAVLVMLRARSRAPLPPPARRPPATCRAGTRRPGRGP